MKKLIAALVSVVLLTAASVLVKAQPEPDVIEITQYGNQAIPVSVSGFSGEVDQALKFDLYVVGFKIVEASEANYQISGNNKSHVEGKLERAGTTVFSRAYQGANLRNQAHAFAADIVKEIRGGKNIFDTKIAYRVEQGQKSEVMVADFDGYNAIPATQDGSMVNGPCWVPGKRKLMYASWKNGRTQIFTQDLATGERKVFLQIPGSNYAPAVSRDGRRVALISTKSGSPDLFVCNIDGSDLKQLTRTKDEESSPCWSPDGRSICYVYRSGRAALYKINADGGTAQRISCAPAGGNITEPDWSPDGKSIVFTSFAGGFSIWTVPAAGGEAVQAVAGEDASWGPNSRTVIFTRRESQKRVLSLLDVPTKHVKDVSKISGSCSQPAWAR